MSGADRGLGATDEEIIDDLREEVSAYSREMVAADKRANLAERKCEALESERSALANRVKALESALTDAYGIANDRRGYGEYSVQLSEISDVCERALLTKSKPVCGTCGGRGWIGSDDPAPHHFTEDCPDCAEEKL